MSENKEIVLSVEHLSKSFGKRAVVRDVSFDCYAGEVFGFVGPNGAGKTTTIKIAVGMLFADAGKIIIDGYDLESDFEKAMANVGGIVESPEFYSYMSGHENLMQYARMRGITDKQRINEVVHLVGLSARIHDKVKKYSLGMRQRLGIAQALLHKPKLLILDEPTNGLDPAGIKDLRDIFKRVAHEDGCAVLVSSHLMSEMELMCDRVAVISRGELLAVKSIEDMLSSASGNLISYVLRVSDAEKAGKTAAELSCETKILDANTLEISLPTDEAEALLPKVNAAVIVAGVDLHTVVHKENRRLEDAYIEITGGKEGGTIV